MNEQFILDFFGIFYTTFTHLVSSDPVICVFLTLSDQARQRCSL